MVGSPSYKRAAVLQKKKIITFRITFLIGKNNIIILINLSFYLKTAGHKPRDKSKIGVILFFFFFFGSTAIAVVPYKMADNVGRELLLTR